MFLVPWPEVPLRWLPGYGLAFGTLQFLFLSWEMAAGMAAGLASPVLQATAPFTVVLGAIPAGAVDRRAGARDRDRRRWARGRGCAPAQVAAILPFLLAVARVVEGPSRIWAFLAPALTPEALLARLGLAYGTVVGTGIWTWLMARHPAGVVAPYSLLVPVAGMLAAWFALGERVSGPELLGGVIVVTGVRPVRCQGRVRVALACSARLASSSSGG